MRKIIWRAEYAYLYKGADAQKVTKEILSIGDAVTPQQMVEFAKDETTELHKCFEWDDEAAAYQFRLQQARNITHHLIIEEDNPEPDKPPLRFLVTTEKGSGYKPITAVFKREDEYQQLLKQAMNELHAFKQKYARLTELQEIFDLIA